MAGVGALLAAFGASVAIIVLPGTRLAAAADQLADRTGLGEAIFGAVFLGAATSLPGITVSFVAGADGNAELAAGNALGDNGFDTLFLAAADAGYRQGSVYHAAGPALVLLTAISILLTAVLMSASSGARSGELRTSALRASSS